MTFKTCIIYYGDHRQQQNGSNIMNSNGLATLQNAAWRRASRITPDRGTVSRSNNDGLRAFGLAGNSCNGDVLRDTVPGSAAEAFNYRIVSIRTASLRAHASAARICSSDACGTT